MKDCSNAFVQVQLGTVDSDIIARYIVLSGSYCILKYVEQITGSQFPDHSLRIVLESGFRISEKMSIDRRSAINLELVVDSVKLVIF
jgi:hypothetical protein